MMQRLKKITYGTWKKSLQFKQDNRRKKIQEEIIQEVIKTGKLNPGEY